MRAIAKRILLFIVVNFFILITISFILSIFNVRPYLNAHGINYGQLLIFCLIWGMTGAFISLALSRIMAKWMMGVQVIDPAHATLNEQKLLDTVDTLAKRAGLPKMPEVGVYESSEVNAFATGPTSSRALVAVSTGLLRRLNGAEIEGVLGHEIAHIANGDMVTMTLLQGIVNAFVMFFARAIAFVLTRAMRRDNDSSPAITPLYSVLVFVLEIVFMLLGAIVIATYSRFREFRADSGGARLAGRQKMIEALKALQSTLHIQDPRAQKPALQAFKISSSQGFLGLFSSHPPLEERIARLEQEG